MHIHPSITGYIAAFLSCLAFGSFSVPMKTNAIKSIDIDPLVFQTYKTVICFISSVAVLGLGVHELTFTPWGLVSGLFWVPAGVTFIIGVRVSGLAITGAICSCVNLFVSFTWGILIFQERIKSFSSACLALSMMTIGLAGMSFFGSTTSSSSSSKSKSLTSLLPHPSSTTIAKKKSSSSSSSSSSNNCSTAILDENSSHKKKSINNIKNIFREAPPPESFFGTLKLSLLNFMDPLPGTYSTKADSLELVSTAKTTAATIDDSDNDDNIGCFDETSFVSSAITSFKQQLTATMPIRDSNLKEINHSTDIEEGTTAMIKTEKNISADFNQSKRNAVNPIITTSTDTTITPMSRHIDTDQQQQQQLRLVNTSVTAEEEYACATVDENETYDRLQKPNRSSKKGKKRRRLTNNSGGSSNGSQSNKSTNHNAKGAHAFVSMLRRLLKEEYGISVTPKQMGIIISSLGSSWGASVMVPLKFAGKECQGLRFVFSFAVGAVFATAMAWTIRFYYHYLYDNQTRKSYYKSFNALPSFHFKEMALPGAMSGVLWSIGNMGSILSVTHLGTGIGYCLVQSSMLVTGSWGIYYFHEITDKKAIRLWLSCACLTIAGILLLSYNHLPPTSTNTHVEIEKEIHLKS